MAFSDHVKVIFGADTKGFQTELGRAHDRAKQFKNKMATLLTGALGAVAFKRGTQAVIDYGTELSNMGTRLGVSTDFLQKYNFAANQSGIKTNAANTALQRFLRRAAEAKDKGGPLKDTLDDLGISFVDVNGVAKSGEALFREFGVALGSIDDPAKKLKTAFQFLDTEGVALTQMFQDAKDPIEAMGNEAERLGLILSDDTVQDLRKAGDQLDELKTTFTTALAQGLIPFIRKLSDMKQPIAGAIQSFGKWAPKIAAVVGVLGALKVALSIKAIIAGTVVAITQLGTALGVLKNAMIALNVAINANGFTKLAAVVSGVAAVAITALADKFGLFEDKVVDTANKIEKAINPQIDVLKNKLAATQQETKTLREELEKLNKVDVKLGIDQLELNLLNAGAAIQKNIDALKNQIEQQKELVRGAEEHVFALEDAGAETQAIEKATIALLQKKQTLATTENSLEKQLKKQLEIQNQRKALVEKINQLQQAQTLGMKDLFDGSNKVTVELRRQKEINEALKNGGGELVEKVKERHEFEDKVKQLVTQGKMTMKEAVGVAGELVKKKGENKDLLDKIKEAEKGAKQVADQRDGVEAAILEKLKQQLAQQKLNRLEADKQLQVLKLQAAGQDDKAKALQAQFDMEKEILRVMQQQGLNLQQAKAKIQEKEQLENQVKLNIIDQQIEEKKMGGIRELANKKLRDAINHEEKQRIRKAKKIIFLENQILDKKGEQNDLAVKQVKEWEKIKEREVALLLDDATKQDLDELKREKVQLVDNHAQQMAALNAAQQAVQADAAKAAADAAAQRAAVAADNADIAQKIKDLNDAGVQKMAAVGDAQVQKLDQINNNPAVKDAVKDTKDAIDATKTTLQDTMTTCCDRIVDAINNIKINTSSTTSSNVPPTPTAPTIINQVTVNIQSELKESTQKSILQTLQGYFVNI